ncbi:MAG: hypothetical protein J1F63_07635 [Oscillospiraceae bacterium]|nr:hypothetical protein [Oscillospiraceae bacterium]
MNTERIKDFIGAEALAFHCSSAYAELCLDKGSVRIDNGKNVWRVVHCGKIVASTRDLYIYCYDSYPGEYHGIADDLELDNIELEDMDSTDEYNDIVYERLEAHRDKRLSECAELLEGRKVVKIEESTSGDATIALSGDITIEIFRVAN